MTHYSYSADLVTFTMEILNGKLHFFAVTKCGQEEACRAKTSLATIIVP